MARSCQSRDFCESNISWNNQNTVGCGELTKKKGEISPNAGSSVKETNINSNEQYIVDCEENTKKGGEILPDTATSKENDRMGGRSENCTWFANSVYFVSKW